VRRIRVAAAVVLHAGRVLLTQRPPEGTHAMMWEFPGGKIERGESPARALVREIAEELGVRAMPHEVMGSSAYEYPNGLHVEIQFVRCTLASLEFKPNHEVNDVRWVAPADVDLGEVLAADRDFLVTLGARRPAADGG
jgi:8-oxo-dGTP diphosphatase